MKRSLIIHNPVFRILAPPFVGLLAYLLILLFYNDFSLFVSFFTGQELYLVIGITYSLFELQRLVIFLTNRIYPYQKWGLNSVIVQLSSSLILSGVVVYNVIGIYFDFVLGFSVSGMQSTVFLSTFLSFVLLYQIFYYGLFFLNIRNEGKLEEEKIRNEEIVKAATRFTNEINPGMLYESLETLIVLSRRNPDEADEFINSLSSIYRYILSNKQDDLVPISQELEMATIMSRILNQRFSGSISWQVEEGLAGSSIQLIPGTIPKILERIVDNSIVSIYSPLSIACSRDEGAGYIEISYPLNEKLVRKDHGILEEIQRSYTFLSEKPVVQVKAYGQGYIKIPILQLKTA